MLEEQEIKDAGRRAIAESYNTYCRVLNWHTLDGEPLPSWDQLQPEYKAAWYAAVTEMMCQVEATAKGLAGRHSHD